MFRPLPHCVVISGFQNLNPPCLSFYLRLKIKYSGLGADATIFYGQSLIEKLTSFLTETLNTSSGQLSTRETTINNEVSDQS